MIQRYQLVQYSDGGDVIKDETGTLVQYGDHAAHVARLEGLLTSAINLVEWYSDWRAKDEGEKATMFLVTAREALARPQESEKCAGCERLFDSKDALSDHLEFCALKPPPAKSEIDEKLDVICTVCGHRFGEHAFTDQDQDDDTHVCPIGGTYFRSEPLSAKPVTK